LWIACGALAATGGIALVISPHLATKWGYRSDDATLGMEFVFGAFLVVVGVILAGLGVLALRGVTWARWASVMLLGYSLFFHPRVGLAAAGVWLAYRAWRRWRRRTPSFHQAVN
jgi:hypothetical protein